MAIIATQNNIVITGKPIIVRRHAVMMPKSIITIIIMFLLSNPILPRLGDKSQLNGLLFLDLLIQ